MLKKIIFTSHDTLETSNQNLFEFSKKETHYLKIWAMDIQRCFLIINNGTESSQSHLLHLILTLHLGSFGNPLVRHHPEHKNDSDDDKWVDAQFFSICEDDL